MLIANYLRIKYGVIMLKLRNNKGFTFLEILVALGIMAFGFLAMSQMQFLSLRQKQLAEDGTIATNMIQFIADRDMAELKRVHLLNATAFTEAQAGRLMLGSTSEPHLQHCLGEKNVCATCPCNPLEVVTLDPTPQFDPAGNPLFDTTCAVVNVHNFDPNEVEINYESPGCDAGSQEAFYLVKRVQSEIDNTVTPAELTLTITYAIKDAVQFGDTGFDSVSLKDSLASQDFVITAHQEDWSELMGAGWNQVVVPHVP